MSKGVVVRGGLVVSLDPDVGDVPDGEVVVEDGRITYVGPTATDRDLGDHEVIDARGKVVLPGLVDTHRHTWQTQLRAICVDASLPEYHRIIRAAIVPHYAPEDVHTGNHLGALEAIDAGVTTLADFSHCIETPEHADAAIEGLSDAGIRGVFCYGFAPAADGALTGFDARVANYERLRGGYDWTGRMRMAVGMGGPRYAGADELGEQVKLARRHGDRIFCHTGTTVGAVTYIAELYDAGLLGPDQVQIHGNMLSDDEWRMFGEAGVYLSSSPETELNMGMGPLAIVRSLRLGLLPTLSCDVVSLNSGDLFAQMRLALAFERYADNRRTTDAGGMPEELVVGPRDALEWATVNAAKAVGLDEEVGSLTVGKQGDVIVIGGSPATFPLLDPAGLVVFHASRQDVTDVVIGGEVRKRHGALVGVDLAEARAQAERSVTRILSRIGDEAPAAITAAKARLARSS